MASPSPAKPGDRGRCLFEARLAAQVQGAHGLEYHKAAAKLRARSFPLLAKLEAFSRNSIPDFVGVVLFWKLPWYFGSGSLTYCMTLPFHNLSRSKYSTCYKLLIFVLGFSFNCKIPGRLPRAHPLSLQSNQQTSPSHQAGSERPNQRSRNHPAQLSTCSSMTVVPSVRFL